MKYGLPNSTIDRICAVFEKHPQIERVILYGSRARGNHKNSSDIDMTICDAENMTLQQLDEVSQEIDDLLLPYMIDLSILRHINDLPVLAQIRRFGVSFYTRRTQHTEDEKETMSGTKSGNSDKDGIDALPDNKPAVYIITGKQGKSLYVGTAKRGRVRARLKEHLPGGKDPIAGGKKIQIQQKSSIQAALKAEDVLIKRLKPIKNKQGK